MHGTSICVSSMEWMEHGLGEFIVTDHVTNTALGPSHFIPEPCCPHLQKACFQGQETLRGYMCVYEIRGII
jgi:hypothetical protein